MKFRSLWVLAIVGACGVAVPGLEDAVARALGTHPSLKADAAQLEAARSRAGREALAPSLQVYALIALLQSASACFRSVAGSYDQSQGKHLDNPASVHGRILAPARYSS